MLQLRFTELHLLAAESRSNIDRGCAFFVSPEKGRCKRPILRPPSQLEELHDKLCGEDDIDSTDRTEILKQIAALCLCNVHKDGNIPPAIDQWQSEIESHMRPAKPQTPTPKKDQDHEQIQFECSPTTKKLSESLKQVDVRVRHALVAKANIMDKTAGKLYIFSHEHAPGLYKIGTTKCFDRRRKQHEHCYPGLDPKTYVECPNAKVFERVVHAELAQFQRFHTCTECKTKPVKHKEWFEAPLSTILNIVRTWSLYATMLYETGFSIDGNHQRLPLPGFSDRPDRWRRWATGEISRWMDANPNPTPVLPVIATPKKADEMDNFCEPDSEHSSTSSSPASLSDTPGMTPVVTPVTTPATTPETTPGSGGHEKADYGLSPTPAGRYHMPGSLDEDKDEDEDVDEDVDDLTVGPTLPLERNLFGGKKDSPSVDQEAIRSDDAQKPEPTRDRNAENLDTDPVSNDSLTSFHPSSLADTEIKRALKPDPDHTEKAGTIYLTKHAETDSYKIYLRGPNSRQKNNACFSKQNACFKILSKDTYRVQSLVLAEFADRKERRQCSECNHRHFNWINSGEERIKDSLRAWTEFVEMGYDYNKISLKGLSQDPDRWTKWARGAVAMGRNDEISNLEAKSMEKKLQEDGPPSGELRTSAEEPRLISRTGTDAASEGHSKGGGRGGRVSTLKEGMTSQESGSLLTSKPWAERLLGMFSKG
ncbi:T5orf172 domain-containing protein [Aspergillus granulosus]|uniref:T5orf172 domain-containing protein n=1 Tax=Aspergillus granulosus TaxID=176169 RepID=A0ABR4HG36_9EURO